METSEQINELAAALSKAQGEMGGAVKESANPFFKSKYADLASVRDAVREPFAKNGLSVVQSPSAEGARVCVETLLLHASGQWIRGTVSTTAKDETPQSVGSAITYLRRYALQSFAGVAPEDDDAEAAQGRGAKPSTVAVMPPRGYDDWLTDLAAVADDGTPALEKAWKASKPEYRSHLTATNAKGWDALKAKAARNAESVGA